MVTLSFIFGAKEFNWWGILDCGAKEFNCVQWPMENPGY
jgi:hypothetical protein